MGLTSSSSGTPRFEGVTDHRADDAVRFAERHPLSTSHSARSMAARAGPSAAAAHPRGVEGRASDEPAQAPEARGDLVERVEERLLVLLQIAVVGEREALQRGEQPGQVADQATGFSLASSAISGFFFCGSIELPVAQASSSTAKPNSSVD